MFTLGVIGTLGNFGAGSLADRFGGRIVVAVALLWMVGALVVFPIATGAFGPALVMIVVYGAAAFAITTPQQHRLITLDPESASVLIALNAAILYLAISLSGAVGALGIAWAGANSLPDRGGPGRGGPHHLGAGPPPVPQAADPRRRSGGNGSHLGAGLTGQG